MKFKTLKGAALVAVTSMLPLSQAAMAEVTISGWINEGVQFYDDGNRSDAVQVNDNGTTLGSRITFAGETEVSPGLTAGFEVILEPNQTTNTPLIFSNQSTFEDHTGNDIGTLGSSLHVVGAWGKVTAGLQSMPTDNIAVLEDPSRTLWSGISPVFRGNGFTINGDADAGAVWGNFLNCFTASGLRGAGGIGLDCNGIYRNGVRYDLPAFGPVTIAVGYANDDVYDISAKWKGDLGSVKASLALGYAINQGVNPATAADFDAAIASPTPGAVDFVLYDEAENFQLQAGLMHPATGLFGSIAYQHEEADLVSDAQTLATATQAVVQAVATAAGLEGGGAAGTISDDSDAWWLKVGVKKQWFSVGDTSLSFDYGQYSDQYGFLQTVFGVTGSEVERIGVAVDQYFGSSLIIYGKWEQLDLDIDGGPLAQLAYGDSDELDTFTLGAVYFF